jgi:hypothetical protein
MKAAQTLKQLARNSTAAGDSAEGKYATDPGRDSIVGERDAWGSE